MVDVSNIVRQITLQACSDLFGPSYNIVVLDASEEYLALCGNMVRVTDIETGCSMESNMFILGDPYLRHMGLIESIKHELGPQQMELTI